jgi:3-hydroxybutyryl-CoA dehydrogenase
VLGAGVMGSSLAQALALTAHDVTVVDTVTYVLEAAQEGFVKNIRLQMLLSKEVNKEDPSIVMKRVVFSEDIHDLKDADYIVENIPEKWDVKKDAFTQLDGICKQPCIFASNTSAIPITKLAAQTKRPDRFIGLHFMNPVTLKHTVEMIRTKETSTETIEATKQFLHQMKKNWILVNDAPGFVSNRVLMLTINEAIYLLKDGVATAEDIDKVFKSCFGNKMGPLETADLIGLDTIKLSLEVLLEHFDDTKFEPCPLLTQMVDKGLFGRKSGKGFFNYTI